MAFYRCGPCGNVIAHIHDPGVRCQCCGEEMEPPAPDTAVAAGVKHVPVVRVDGRTAAVTVGSVERPMPGAHCVEWILPETKKADSARRCGPSPRSRSSGKTRRSRPAGTATRTTFGGPDRRSAAEKRPFPSRAAAAAGMAFCA